MTRKQRKFIKEFIKSHNATEAAIEAYNCKDRVTAASIGYENLRKPHIQEAVKLHLQEEGIYPTPEVEYSKHLVKLGRLL